jgi:pimeloyl-ACP methyl ester carboxylesterase
MRKDLCGAPISWTDTGNGPVLLLVHGLPFHSGIWSPMLPFLERHFRVVAVDLPGFGESADSPEPPSMEAYADILRALLAELGDPPSIVVGHSMGGYALLNLALRKSVPLAGLVLLCSRATADRPDQAANRIAMALRLQSETADFVAEGMLPKMPAKGSADPALLNRIRKAMDPLRPSGIAWCQRAIAARPDSSARLGEIVVPSLVVAGLQDAIIPLEESGIVAANLRNGRLVVLEDAGHCPMFEKPRETAEAILSWARQASLVP